MEFFYATGNTFDLLMVERLAEVKSYGSKACKRLKSLK